MAHEITINSYFLRLEYLNIGKRHEKIPLIHINIYVRTAFTESTCVIFSPFWKNNPHHQVKQGYRYRYMGKIKQKQSFLPKRRERHNRNTRIWRLLPDEFNKNFVPSNQKNKYIMLKRTVYLFVLLLAISQMVFAEVEKSYNVTGKVTDTNGNGLPYASVLVMGTNIGIATDANGYFGLNVKPGNYTLRVTYTGYIPEETEIDASDKANLTIVMEEAKNDLNEVVVTGTRTQQMLKNVPVLTRVITNEDIKRVDPQDFQELMEFAMPGLLFQGSSHGSGLPSINFQGVSGNYILFLVDGERIAGQGAQDNIDFNSLNIDNVERIEIVKGAMSTLYGSNALGGVINIITKNPNRPFVGNISSRVSSRKDQKYTLSLGTKQEKFYTLTTASYSRKNPYVLEDKEGETTIYERPNGSDSIAVDEKGSLSVKGYESYQIEQKLGYNFSEKLDFSVTGDFYNNEIKTATEAKKNDRFRKYGIKGKLSYIFDENSHMDLTYNHDNYWKHDLYPLTGENSLKYRDIINTVRLNYNRLIAQKHSLTVGLEMDAEKLNDYFFKDTAANDVQNYVLYAQDDYRILDNLSVVAGVRLDYHSEYDLHCSPQVSAMYRLKNVTFRAGYGAGFRSPSLKELYADWSHQGMFTLYGNPDLKPETSNHISLSGEYTAGIFNGSVSGYYNWFKNKIEMVSRNDEVDGQRMPNQTYANAEKAKTFGVDVNAQVKLPYNIQIKGAYSYVNDDTKVDGRNQSAVRPHTAVLRADYSPKIGKCQTSIGLNGRWMSSVEYWSYNSSKQMYSMTKYADRMIWKLNASAQFPRGITLNIGIDNLFNYKDKNVSGDIYASLTRGTEFVANLSINIAELIGR